MYQGEDAPPGLHMGDMTKRPFVRGRSHESFGLLQDLPQEKP